MKLLTSVALAIAAIAIIILMVACVEDGARKEAGDVAPTATPPSFANLRYEVKAPVLPTPTPTRTPAPQPSPVPTPVNRDGGGKGVSQVGEQAYRIPRYQFTVCYFVEFGKVAMRDTGSVITFAASASPRNPNNPEWREVTLSAEVEALFDCQTHSTQEAFLQDRNERLGRY